MVIPLHQRPIPTTVEEAAVYVRDWLYSLGLDHGGHINLFILDGERKESAIRRCYWLNPETLLDDLPLHLQFSWNNPSSLIYGPNLHDISDNFRGERSVVAVRAFGLDIDSKRKGLEHEERIRRLQALFERAQPLGIVKSGSADSYHVYYRYSEEPEPAISKALVKRIRLWLDLDPSEAVCKGFRLPYSAHWKNRPPVMIQVVGHSPEARVTVGQLEAALDALGAPAVPVKPETRRRWTPTRRELGEFPEPLQPHPVLLASVERWLNPKAWDVINQGMDANHDQYPSRSEAEAAAVRYLIQAGASDDFILWVLYHYPCGERAQERGIVYARDMITRFRDYPLEAVEAQIIDVGRGSRYSYVVTLTILSGEFQGRELHEKLYECNGWWPYFFISLGIVPPPRFDALHPTMLDELRTLIGRTVTLEVWTPNEGQNVNTIRWLPATPPDPLPPETVQAPPMRLWYDDDEEEPLPPRRDESEIDEEDEGDWDEDPDFDFDG